MHAFAVWVGRMGLAAYPIPSLVEEVVWDDIMIVCERGAGCASWMGGALSALSGPSVEDDGVIGFAVGILICLIYLRVSGGGGLLVNVSPSLV